MWNYLHWVRRTAALECYRNEPFLGSATSLFSFLTKSFQILGFKIFCIYAHLIKRSIQSNFRFDEALTFLHIGGCENNRENVPFSSQMKLKSHRSTSGKRLTWSRRGGSSGGWSAAAAPVLLSSAGERELLGASDRCCWSATSSGASPTGCSERRRRGCPLAAAREPRPPALPRHLPETNALWLLPLPRTLVKTHHKNYGTTSFKILKLQEPAHFLFLLNAFCILFIYAYFVTY